MYSISEKICDDIQLGRTLARWRFQDETIVFTNGCFDLIHFGHISYLENASQLGTKLVIGLNSDESVRLLKGENRPVKDENSRAHILAAMEFVDAVYIFNEETPAKLIETVAPNVLVKGGDYKVEDVVGADFVLSKGGKIEIIDFVDGYSSSSIIEKIKNS